MNSPFSLDSPRFTFAVAILFGFLSWFIFRPGIQDFWLFDDYSNILRAPDVHITELSVGQLADAAASGNAGPLKRPIPVVSFALNYYVSGVDAAAFKMFNVFLHAMNGVVLFLMMLVLLRACRNYHEGMGWLDADKTRKLSFYIALLWVLHPLNLTTVLYVVQRMNGMAFFFMCCSCIAYINMRQAMIEAAPYLRHLVLAVAFLLMGVLSKENAATIALFFLFLELLLFKFRAAVPAWQKALPVLYFAGLVSVVLLCVVFWDRLFAPAYRGEDYSPVERLLTQSRAIFIYLRQILVPDVSKMFLHHDGFAVSRGIFSPPTTAFSVAGVLAIWFLAWMARKKYLLLSLGVCLYFSTHLLESSIIPLMLYFEHRNYFPMAGILLAVVGTGGFYYFRYSGELKRLFTIFLVLVPVLLSAVTLQRASSWQDFGTWTAHELARKPDSAPQNYEYAQYLFSSALQEMEHYPDDAREKADQAKVYFKKALEADDSFLLAYIGVLRVDDQVNGEFNEEYYRLLLERLKSQPFTNVDAVNVSNELAACTVMKICSFPAGKIIDILEYLAVHPGIRPEEKLAFENNIASLLMEDAELDMALERILKIIKSTARDVDPYGQYMSWLLLLEIESRKGKIVYYDELKKDAGSTLPEEYWRRLEKKKELELQRLSGTGNEKDD